MSEADNPGKGKISFLQQGLMGLLTTLWGRSRAQEPKTDPTIFFMDFLFPLFCFGTFHLTGLFHFGFDFHFGGIFV